MTISDAVIRTAVESSLLTLAEMPPQFETLHFPGLQGHYAPQISNYIMNMVGQSSLTVDDADSIIAAVSNHFAELNLAFSWLTSEMSTPADLNRRLEAVGMVPAGKMSGMFLDRLDVPIVVNPHVHVCRATSADTDDLVRLYRDAYPLPEDVAALMVSMRDTWRMISYLGYVDDEHVPVAVASMYYLADEPIVALQGAATLGAYRGRGIYTALMAQRLVDAREDGMEVAVMQANNSTSAPICRNLGFTTCSEMTLYISLRRTVH